MEIYYDRISNSIFVIHLNLKQEDYSFTESYKLLLRVLISLVSIFIPVACTR